MPPITLPKKVEFGDKCYIKIDYPHGIDEGDRPISDPDTIWEAVLVRFGYQTDEFGFVDYSMCTMVDEPKEFRDPVAWKEVDHRRNELPLRIYEGHYEGLILRVNYEPQYEMRWSVEVFDGKNRVHIDTAKSLTEGKYKALRNARVHLGEIS